MLVFGVRVLRGVAVGHLLFALGAGVLVGCSGRPDPRVEAVSRAIENFVKPSYAALNASGATMAGAVERLCERPGMETLAQARSAFGGLVTAWSRAEVVRIGPMLADNRQERVLFWPDRRSRGLAQIKATITETNPKALSAESLRQMSVAVQGLGALEFVLFGEGSETLGLQPSFRCRYAQSIAALLAQNFDVLSKEWTAPDGIARQWSTPTAENAHFRNPTESLNELVGLIFHEIELFRDVRLAGLARMRPGDDDPETVIFWRSGMTVKFLRENLNATHDLLNLSGVGGLLPGEDRSLMDSIHVEFWDADEILAKLPTDLSDASRQPDFKSALQAVELSASNLRFLIGRELAGELGVTAGFSSLDGD